MSVYLVVGVTLAETEHVLIAEVSTASLAWRTFEAARRSGSYISLCLFGGSEIPTPILRWDVALQQGLEGFRDFVRKQRAQSN